MRVGLKKREIYTLFDNRPILKVDEILLKDIKDTPFKEITIKVSNCKLYGYVIGENALSGDPVIVSIDEVERDGVRIPVDKIKSKK